jgi:IS4 transposase
MRHQNTVLHDLTKWIPWGTFEKLVEEHGTDALARRFDSKRHLLALLFGQLAGLSSIREVITAMESHRNRLYHCGAVVPKRSTLADANSKRSSAPFVGLFRDMLARQTRGLRRKMGEAVLLLDSTSLHLAGLGAEWARFSTHVRGAKAHFIYDADAQLPIYHEISAANLNDICAAKPMPIEAGATYVFDLGYYDYAWWAKLHEADCRIVTRFKAPTPLLDAREQPVPAEATAVVSDRIGFLPRRQTKNRRNPMSAPVREIVVRISTGKDLRLLTNDLDAPATEIADLYKRRWQIELFFRLMKQTLRITKFLGRSENAVRIQIAVALIALLIISAARKASEVPLTHLQAIRLVRANLMHRKQATRLAAHGQRIPINDRQLVLELAYP